MVRENVSYLIFLNSFAIKRPVSPIKEDAEEQKFQSFVGFISAKKWKSAKVKCCEKEMK
jgi:hypothetical protein